MIYAEYCFTVFLEGIAWQEVMQTRAEGSPPTIVHYIASEDPADAKPIIELRRSTIEFDQGGLVAYLPALRRSRCYVSYDIFGKIDDVQLLSDENRIAYGRDRPTDLSRALTKILALCPSWALFALVDCDDIGHTTIVDISQIGSMLDGFISDEIPALEMGFALVSK